jgi:histidinol-phosphate aminotransferase
MLSLSAKGHLATLFRTNPHEQSRNGYLRLDMNEGIPGLPSDFVKRTVAAIDEGLLATYPEYQSLRAKIALHNDLVPENILLSNGSDAAIKYIFDAYVSPGDRILLTDPTFAMYPVYGRMFGTDAISVPYRPDLTFPWEEFMDRMVPGVRLAVLVNPNNPTGYAVPAAQIIEMVAHAAQNEILLLVDEAYYYYYPDTVIQAVTGFRNLIVLRTFSKLCGMAALRLGYAAACPEIIGNLRKVRPTYDINGLAVLFGERLLDDPEIMRGLIREARVGKDYLVQKLSEAGIPHREGSANFVLIKCRGRVNAIVSGLAEAKILVSSGFTHGFLKDYVRVTVGSREVMEQFWQAFIKLWKAARA